MVIAKLSLNNPSNIWHCSKEICHTTTDRERERAGEREQVGCQMLWWLQETQAPQVEFPSSVLPVLWMCTTVFAWFTPSLMNCRVWSQVIAFGGALSLYSVSCTSLTKNSKVVFNHFAGGSCCGGRRSGRVSIGGYWGRTYIATTQLWHDKNTIDYIHIYIIHYILYIIYYILYNTIYYILYIRYYILYNIYIYT